MTAGDLLRAGEPFPAAWAAAYDEGGRGPRDGTRHTALVLCAPLAGERSADGWRALDERYSCMATTAHGIGAAPYAVYALTLQRRHWLDHVAAAGDTCLGTWRADHCDGTCERWDALSDVWLDLPASLQRAIVATLVVSGTADASRDAAGMVSVELFGAPDGTGLDLLNAGASCFPGDRHWYYNAYPHLDLRRPRSRAELRARLATASPEPPHRIARG